MRRTLSICLSSRSRIMCGCSKISVCRVKEKIPHAQQDYITHYLELKQTTAIPDRQSSQGVTRPSHHDLHSSAEFLKSTFHARKACGTAKVNHLDDQAEILCCF